MSRKIRLPKKNIKKQDNFTNELSFIICIAKVIPFVMIQVEGVPKYIETYILS